MIVKAELKCSKCKKKAEYTSAEIEFDHVICKNCGAKIGVIKYLAATSLNYDSIKGTVYRKNPKVKMSKKDRRRMRDEANLD